MKTALLAEVCEITMGQAPKGDTYNNQGDGVPLVAGAGDFGEVHPQPKKYTTAEDVRLAAPGDIILGIRASIGDKVLADDIYCLGRGVAGLRAGPEIHDRYLWHWVTHAAPSLAAKGRGATFLQVNKRDVSEMPVPIPPMPEQRRIAAILDTAEKLRTKRRQALAKLDSLSEAFFIEMFGPFGQGNQTWPTEPLGEVVAKPLQNGAYFPKDRYVELGGTEMVHMSDAFYAEVKRGALRRVAASDTETAKYSLGSTDLLVARRSLNYEGSVKPCRIPDSAEPLIFESSLIRVTPNPESHTTGWLFALLNSEPFRRRFIFPFVTGATIHGISQKNLGSVPVASPPVELQTEFDQRTDEVRKSVERATDQAHTLDALFASLRQRAFRSEV